ncbi:MAG: methyltransferase [bacterium]|nr:methyltransferase [bacterium]
MPNSYFQFKQFRIEQGGSGMKVTTEGCILGSWVNAENASNILDIGAGTGLLSLMIAQRSNATIDAVEIDENAAEQTKLNFEKSPWPNRLQLFHNSIQDFKSEKKYDLIVSNPPFFSNHLKNQNQQKNKALHDDLLNQEDLLNSISNLLDDNGNAYILLPEHESRQLETNASKLGFYVIEKLEVYNQPNGRVFRVISKLSNKHLEQTIKKLVIREGNEYSGVFKKLLKEYYLAL